MRNNRFIFNALLLVCLALTELQAQEVIPCAGGMAAGNGGSASYSIGQVVYTSYIVTTGSVAQGVQQPYEVTLINGINETGRIDLIVSAYPNPTTDYLTLKVSNLELPNDITGYSVLSFQLFDISGNLLESEELAGNETSISMGNFLPGTYFLKITTGNKGIKTFKIIKK